MLAKINFFSTLQIFLIVLFYFTLNCNTTYANILPTGFNLSYGGLGGNPNEIQGGRAALQWDWRKVWFADSAINLTGYWDLSYAYWNTNGNAQGQNKSINIFAFAPVLRLQSRDMWWNAIKPYLEASVGLAGMSNNYLGNRNLGAYWAFQDMLGLGFLFGNKQQFDFNYRFLHYSNANLAPANAGITVAGLFTLGYRFD